MVSSPHPPTPSPTKAVEGEATDHVTVNIDRTCIVIHKETCKYVFWDTETGAVRQKRWVEGGTYHHEPVVHLAKSFAELLEEADKHPRNWQNK